LNIRSDKRRKIRAIDPALNLGLHELANSGERAEPFRFQLAFAKDQAEDILQNLTGLVEGTERRAPIRTKDFCLNRKTSPTLTHEEDKWERGMYGKWGPEGFGEYVPICKRIQTYQYPLQSSFKDRCWGKIDLLGIGPDSLPVPNELKKRSADESPLRMLLEVAAYGFAIRIVWPHLKSEWARAINWFGQPQLPENLDRVTLVGVAPVGYWCQCLGLLPETQGGQFPPDAWRPFWQLVDALGGWFDIHFVAVEGIWDSDVMGGSPAITGARILDLRSLTLDPSLGTAAQAHSQAGRNALLEGYRRTVVRSQ
jgi:hypothetical protein